MGVIKFGGVSSETIELIVETRPDYEMPLKKYERVHVPGRNGDIIIDTGEYDNVDRVYNVACYKEGVSPPYLSRELSKWLSKPGYQRLEDSYQPDVYMMAVYEQENTVTNIHNQAGRASISFNRMPQRFLKIGEDPIEMTVSGEDIVNPSPQLAVPIIKIYGTNGLVKIGEYSIGITNVVGHVTIDSVTASAYTYNVSMTGSITLSDGYPRLPGDARIPIEWRGDITKVEIIPNWWVI